MDEEKKRPPSADSDKYIVRLPDGMRQRLKDAAASNNRTLNAELIDRLERSFREPAMAQTSEFLTGVLLLSLSRVVAARVEPGTFAAQDQERVEQWMQFAVALASGDRGKIGAALTVLLGEEDESSVAVLYRLVLAQEMATRTAQALASIREHSPSSMQYQRGPTVSSQVFGHLMKQSQKTTDTAPAPSSAPRGPGKLKKPAVKKGRR